jgi:hypothetical protein
MDVTPFEEYFYKGPRLFSVMPVKKESRHKTSQFLEKTSDFIHQFQLSRALARQYSNVSKSVFIACYNITKFSL